MSERRQKEPEPLVAVAVAGGEMVLNALMGRCDWLECRIDSQVTKG